MMKQLCPICRKTGTCQIAPNGKRGYCKTHKKRWKLERVPTTELGKMQPGQIQHEDLIPFEEDLMRWSYRIVGHYVQDTLEQWELGDQFSNVLTFRRRRFGFVQHAVPHSSQRRLFGVLTRPERFRRNKISSAKKPRSSRRGRCSLCPEQTECHGIWQVKNMLRATAGWRFSYRKIQLRRDL